MKTILTNIKNLTESIEYKTQIIADDFLYAPISKGDVVGSIERIVNGEVTETLPIIATEDIPCAQTDKNLIDRINSIALAFQCLIKHKSIHGIDKS